MADRKTKQTKPVTVKGTFLRKSGRFIEIATGSVQCWIDSKSPSISRIAGKTPGKQVSITATRAYARRKHMLAA